MLHYPSSFTFFLVSHGVLVLFYFCCHTYLTPWLVWHVGQTMSFLFPCWWHGLVETFCLGFLTHFQLPLLLHQWVWWQQCELSSHSYLGKLLLLECSFVETTWLLWCPFLEKVYGDLEEASTCEVLCTPTLEWYHQVAKLFSSQNGLAVDLSHVVPLLVETSLWPRGPSQVEDHANLVEFHKNKKCLQANVETWVDLGCWIPGEHIPWNDKKLLLGMIWDVLHCLVLWHRNSDWRQVGHLLMMDERMNVSEAIGLMPTETQAVFAIWCVSEKLWTHDHVQQCRFFEFCSSLEATQALLLENLNH